MTDAPTNGTVRALRRRSSLEGAWQYRPDNPEFAFGEHLGWEDPGLDDADWRTMQVPACWDLADSTLHGYEGFVWFRRRFIASPSPDRQTMLCFEGVNYRADVWLNGVYLGFHEGGFTPFSFRIDQRLDQGGENVLVVRVDNRSLPERIPGARLSWFNYGGLYREIYLEERPLVAIEDIWLDPRPQAAGRHGPAQIVTEVALVNNRVEPFSGQLTVTFDGKTLSTAEDVPAGGETVVRGEIALDDAEYWSPEQPRLFPASVELSSISGPMDHLSCNIGIRRLTVDDTRILLNGEAVKIKGFNRHEDYPTTGRSHDENMLWEDLRTIKASGANFIRACHYPQHSRFYDACDQLGIMVMDEIPLWGWGRRRDMAPDGGTAPAEAAHQQLAEMVRRDRNRTCVVIWSVSNETGGGQPDVDKANVSLIRRVREMDPSRLVTHVTLHGVWTAGNDAAMAEDDVLCLNEYVGSLHNDPPVRTREDLDVVKAILGRQLDDLHHRFPDKPMLVTEFGGIGLPGHHGDFPWSEEFYGDTIRAHWETMVAKPWVVGGLLWSWQDYPLHPNRQRWYPLGHYGVFTEDRRAKAAASTMEELFAAY